MAEILKEFLVSLGFRVEGNQEQKFKSAVGSATNAVIDLGKAAAVASTAVSAAVIAIGKSLDSLYWQAQRTNTSVSQIRSATYAISQLGGSVDGARSSIESFGKQLRWHDGFEGYIRQLGVVTRENGRLRDSTVLAREFALTIAKLPKGVQKAHADLAGMDLPTLEALQSPEYQKNAAKHAETIKKLGVNEDEAAKKSKDLVNSLTSLNDTFTALGTLLVDRLGPGLTDFFGKVERFLQNHSETIVAVFKSLGEAIGNVAAFLEKAAEWAGPLFQKFDALTKSLVGTDGLTAALTALIGLGVASWLMKVAAAITSVGTAASVALLGGALGKFLGLFGIGAAIAIGASTEANAGEDQEIARRRAAGTFGPASPGDLEADAAKRQQGQSKDTSLWGKVKRWWNGGDDASSKSASTAPISGTSFGQKAPGIMKRLMEDFGFTKEQAAGVMGNLGHESGGLQQMQELNPTRGRGGWGWAQWTGPRRRAFETWAAEKGLDPSSDEANYGFMKRELETTHKSVVGAVKGTQSSSDAMRIFEDGYEGAGVKNYGSRQRWTDRALKAFDAAPAQEPVAQSAAPQQGRSGFKVDNNLGASDKGNLAKGSLFYNGQSIAGQNLDPKLTKTEKGGASLFDPSSILIKAADNAEKAGGAGLGGNGTALTPPPSSTAGTTVTIDQRNEINVTGSGDPHDTAQQIGNSQRDVNAGMIRDLKGATR
jgi:hypothetical protein